MTKKTFEVWMAEVDGNLVKLCGLSNRDLPDVCYRDWYDDGRAPLSAARKAIRYAEAFARTELHRELKTTTETCWWCGGTRGEGKVRRLYKYRTEGDGGRKSEHTGLFCSRACFDDYHCL